MDLFKIAVAVFLFLATVVGAPAQTQRLAGCNAVADAAAAQTRCVTDSFESAGDAEFRRGSATILDQLASKHLRCPAVTGAFCDDYNHVCCLVRNVYKCCPSLSHSCCRE